MVDSLTVSGVDEVRALASSDRPDPRRGRRSVRDMLAALSIVEEVLLLLPDELRVVGVEEDQIQLSPEDFRAIFHGLTAAVTRFTTTTRRELWVRGIAIVSSEIVKEGWQVPDVRSSLETVPEA